MFGISGDVWGAIGVFGSIGAMVISFVYGRISKADNTAHDLEMQGLKNQHTNDMAMLGANLEREKQDRALLESRVSAAWLKIDDLRENSVRKAELREYRAELKEDIKVLGDRLEKTFREALDNMRRDKSAP